MILLFVHFVHADLLFKGLDDVLSRLEQVEQRPSRALPRLGDMIPLTQVVMRVMLVSHGGGYVPRKRTK